MADFQTNKIELSMTNPETGNYITANVYTVDGIVGDNGLPRQLSIGQLVMAVCLERAAKTESEIVKIMEEMNEASGVLEAITKIEDALSKKLSETVIASKYEVYSFEQLGLNPYDFTVPKNGITHTYADWYEYMNDKFNLTLPAPTVNGTEKYYTQAQIDECISAMETKMDEYNTLNQKKMIELQSQTNKRDQSYDLMSAILKSFNNTMTGIVNNY